MNAVPVGKDMAGNAIFLARGSVPGRSLDLLKKQMVPGVTM